VKTGAVTQRYVSSFRARHQNRELLAVCKLGFVTDFALALVALAVVLLAVLLLGDLPGTHGHADLVIVSALSLPFVSFVGTSIVVLVGFGRFRAVGSLQVMQKIVVLIAVLAALLIQRDAAALVVGNAAGQAAAGVTYLVVASVCLGRAVGDRWWRARVASLGGVLRELRSSLGWNFVGVTLSGAIVQVPVVLLGAIRSPVEAGYFRIASTVAVTADAVEAGMGRVAYSTLSAADSKADVHRVARLIAKWSRREALLGVSAVVIAMALLPGIVVVGLGHRYTGVLAGSELLLVGTAVSTGFFFLSPYLYSTGRVKTWVLSYALYVLVALGASSLLAGTGGFVVVAAVVGIGLALLNAALGLPILRRMHRMATPQGPLEGVSAASAEAGHKS
jgi:O-antigen/teichoic acid export membrane protein